jgi:hypothetical protein
MIYSPSIDYQFLDEKEKNMDIIMLSEIESEI